MKVRLEEVFESFDGRLQILLGFDGAGERDHAVIAVISREPGNEPVRKEGEIQIQELRGAVQCAVLRPDRKREEQILLARCIAQQGATTEMIENALISLPPKAAQAVHSALPKK